MEQLPHRLGPIPRPTRCRTPRQHPTAAEIEELQIEQLTAEYLEAQAQGPAALERWRRERHDMASGYWRRPDRATA